MKSLIAVLSLIVVILLLISHLVAQTTYTDEQQRLQVIVKNICEVPPVRLMDKQQTIDRIVADYKIDRKLATNIVQYAYKYQRDDFPRAHDIIAIIGVESDFIPTAKSKLKKDPAYGLTQVRSKMWNHVPMCQNVRDSVEQQVRCGMFILAAYYKELGSKDDAIHAYNIGLAAFQRGDNNPHYVPKYYAQLSKYQTYEI